MVPPLAISAGVALVIGAAYSLLSDAPFFDVTVTREPGRSVWDIDLNVRANPFAAVGVGLLIAAMLALLFDL